MRTDRLGFDWLLPHDYPILDVSVSIFTNDQSSESLAVFLTVSSCRGVYAHSQEPARFDRFLLARRDHRFQMHRSLEAS